MTHDFDGKKYEKASAHQLEWGTKLVADLDLRGGECVLDLGCGDGTLTASIADAVPSGEVLGIDASESMVDAARPKAGTNVRFLRMDINELDFDERFDLVFSNAALHWVKDHGRVLENVYRSLRPGGRLRFGFARDGNCATFFKVVRHAMAYEEFTNHFTGFEWPFYMPSTEAYLTLAKKQRIDRRARME